MGTRISPPMQSPWLQLPGQPGLIMPDANGNYPTLDPEVSQENINELNAAQNNMFQQQRAGIDELKDQANFAAANAPVQTDISPVLGLVDSWTGSKLAQNYQRPDANQSIDRITKLREAVLKGEQKLTDDQLQLLREKLKQQTTMGLFGAKQTAAVGAQGKKEEKEDLEAREKIIKSDQAKQIEGQIRFNTALNNYIETVQKFEPQDRVAGQGATAIDSAYSKLKTTFKEAEKLGALSGPDTEILIEGMKPASGIKGAWNTIAGGGDDGLISAAENLRGQAKSDFELANSTLKSAYGDKAVPVLKNYGQKFNSIVSKRFKNLSRQEKIDILTGRAGGKK